ncbi:MAG: biosynthetic-type acetolactate synthase large subunit [Candidatus Nezhaarchaeota archaeon]|nr:biosynthetic-type acetolactate synthase large subunit [Candidatus Nezhaarchaeota archaeon]MCX8141436.1 biosynthetic-type acetolactate synthase large subunit [Candidatus Nezhaarchaeota archaeon]MDW8049702.1 biosynthetic-type acetolactate synthase large subunit [Nitrososphaerota archaeon]
MLVSGAEAIVRSLKREGVRVVFGLPGGAILPLYDALYDSDIKHVLGRHEQCVAHMADGFARASGRPGVCIATSGPGATNLVTGIATAYMDSSPIIAITGQVARYMIGKDAFQEADIVGIVTPITKYSFQLTSAREIPRVFKTAFTIATTRRPGPVLIDVPVDVQREQVEIEFTDEMDLKGYNPNPPRVDEDKVKKAAKVLAESERPLILAGGGVKWSGAHEELVKLAELLMAPVATTLMGKGVIAEDHPLSLGMIGMHGKAHANYAVLECDTLLAVGVRFSDRSTGKFDEFAKGAYKIHVDIDSAEINKNVIVDLPIVGDAKEVLRLLIKELIGFQGTKPHSAWINRIKEFKAMFECETEGSVGGGLKPSMVIKTISRLLEPGKSIVTTGVGQNQMWSAIHYIAKSPRSFITSGGLGTMGFGFPAALGAKVACPDKVVVDIDGDGSFLMTEQDLATSVTENIPVIVVILNNSALGMVRQWQHLLYRRRFIASSLGGVPDFVKLAQAFGAEGARPNSYEEFEETFKQAMKSEITTVIDVPISQEERVFPMVLPGRPLSEVLISEPKS